MVRFTRPYGVPPGVPESTDYENRVVAFVDVLGFRRFVELSEQNARLRSHLVRIVRAARVFARGGYEGMGAGLIKHRHAINFSDSIILSEPANPEAALSIMFTVSDIAVEFLSLGFLCRGGISAGKLFHNENVVFGPALVAAYDLESKYAIYPRIIVDSAAASIYSRLNFEGWNSFYRSGVLLSDRDARSYLNILFRHWPYLDGGGQSDKSRGAFLSEIRDILIEMRKRSRPVRRTRRKTAWFIRYFNKVVRAEPQLGIQPIGMYR